MVDALTQEMLEKLKSQENIWFCSVRPDGRPHMAPVWFVWHEDRIYIGTDPKSVKSHNIRRDPQVVLALENLVHPLICEGTAEIIEQPWHEDLLVAFFKKYEWDLNKEDQYNQVIAVSPRKWISW